MVFGLAKDLCSGGQIEGDLPRGRQPVIFSLILNADGTYQQHLDLQQPGRCVS